MGLGWKDFFALRRSTSNTQVTGTRRGIPGAMDVSVGSENCMTVSAFSRGVIYVSGQIAKLPWDVKNDKNVKQFDTIAKLLSLKPNPEMNSMDFRLLAVQTAIIKGNFFAEIERDVLGRAIALWPLRTDSVQLVRSSDGTLFYRVLNDGAPDVYLQSNDVFHVPNFHKTVDGLMGQGVVAYASQTLGISIAADRMASGLFNNGGMPSGILSHPGTLEDSAYERIKKSWKDAHGGRKAGGVAVLEEGVKYEAVNLDPEVLQFLESRKFGVLEVARFLNVPPQKLFDTTASTYSNQEQAQLEVGTDVLDMWACRLEIEADTKLLSNRFGGRYSEIDLRQLYRADATTRSNYNSKMMQMGALTPNEVRDSEGLSPYTGGERYYIARNNYVPADRQDEIIDAEITSKTAPKTSAPSDDKTEEDKETERELTRAALLTLQK